MDRKTAFLALITLCLLTAIGWATAVNHRSYEAERMAQATSDAERLAIAFAEHTEEILRDVDFHLEVVRDEISAHGDFEPNRHLGAPPTFGGDPIGVLAMTGTDGKAVVLKGPSPPSPVSLAGQDYFTIHRDHAADIPAISPPSAGPLSSRPLFWLSRRISAADGSFEGVVVAGVNPAIATAFYRRFDIGPNGTVKLLRADGALIARQGPRNKKAGDATDAYDTRLPALLAKDGAGTFVDTSATDGKQRLYAYRRLDNAPLVVMVGIAREDIADAARAHLRSTSIQAAIAALVVLMAAMTAWRRHAAGERLRLAYRQVAAAKEDAERARRRTEMILASPMEGILGVDTKGTITFSNPAACAMLGWTAEGGIGRPFQAIARGCPSAVEAETATGCPLSLTLRDGTARRVERETFLRADGTPFPVEYAAGAIVGNDKVEGAVVIFRDIGERLAAERALTEKSAELARSNAELEQFAYVASHDLREPLRMISSYLALLDKRLTDLDAETREFLAFAKDGAVRMDHLILDLLQYSRIGRVTHAMAPVPLDDVLEGAVVDLGLAIAEAGAEIRADSLPVVVGDREELMRLFLNLIGNAVKYRAPGRPPVIRVSAEGANGEWVITVADNGIGVPPEHADRIFGIFQRLHGRGTYEGTGIGLAICRKIVEHHGGRIWVDSLGDGQGSAFRFTLPVTPGR